MKGTLAFILILACIGCGQALQCYSCSGSGCGDPFTSSANITCSSIPFTDPACTKIKVLGSVIRTCGSSVGCLACAVVGDDNAVCCCTGELCNGASTRAANYVTLATLMIMGSVLAAL